MADKSLDILIRILTQQVGAEKAQDIVKKVTEETQKSTEATKKNTDAEGKSFTSKKQLKEAIKGLSMEFPILGRVAALALNPIAFAVAAGALAFTIWRRRAEELNRTLAMVELPDLAGQKIGEISAVADAYKKLGEAVAEAQGKFTSAEDVYNTAITNIERHADAQRKLLAANKALALSEATTPEQVAAIEKKFGGAGRELENKVQQDKLLQLSTQKTDLERTAAQKLRQADAIRDQTGFAGATESHIAKMQEDAVKAKAAQAELKQWINLAKKFKRGDVTWGESMKMKGRQFVSGLSPDEMIALDQGLLENTEGPIKRFQDFQRARPLLSRAEGLIQSAGADMAGAATIGMQLPAMSAANQQNSAVAAKVSQLEELAGLNKRIAELEKSISELRSSALTDQVTAGANANTTALQAATKALKVMQTEAANLRTQANSYIR